MKRLFSIQFITFISFLVFTLFSISQANASGYFDYYLDQSRSKITFALTEQVTQTDNKGEFSQFEATISTGIDTPISSWNHTYSTWVRWDDYKDESKVNGTWDHEIGEYGLYQENSFAINVNINSIQPAERFSSFLASDSFNAEVFPLLTLKSLDLTDTKGGKGMIAELTIRGVTKVVYVPIELNETYEDSVTIVKIKGIVEVDLMDFKFKPKKNYRPPFNKERNVHFGFVQLPFELNFELVFTDEYPE